MLQKSFGVSLLLCCAEVELGVHSCAEYRSPGVTTVLQYLLKLEAEALDNSRLKIRGSNQRRGKNGEDKRVSFFPHQEVAHPSHRKVYVVSELLVPATISKHIEEAFALECYLGVDMPTFEYGVHRSFQKLADQIQRLRHKGEDRLCEV